MGNYSLLSEIITWWWNRWWSIPCGFLSLLIKKIGLSQDCQFFIEGDIITSPLSVLYSTQPTGKLIAENIWHYSRLTNLRAPIKLLKSLLSIPGIANGSLGSYLEAQTCLEFTKADVVTGLLRNPSLFILLKSQDNLHISIGNKALSEAMDLVNLWHYLIRHCMNVFHLLCLVTWALKLFAESYRSTSISLAEISSCLVTMRYWASSLLMI
jgi:hypothetical protein